MLCHPPSLERYAPKDRLRSAYAPLTLRLRSAYGSAYGLRLTGVRATGSTEANDGEYFGKRRGGVLGQASGRRSLGKSFRGALLGQLSSSGAAPSSPTPLRGAVSSLYALFWAGGRQAPLPY